MKEDSYYVIVDNITDEVLCRCQAPTDAWMHFECGSGWDSKMDLSAKFSTIEEASDIVKDLTTRFTRYDCEIDFKIYEVKTEMVLVQSTSVNEVTKGE